MPATVILHQRVVLTLDLTCIAGYAEVAAGRRIVRPECVCLRSVIEGIVDGVVSCRSSLSSGVDPEAWDGCWC